MLLDLWNFLLEQVKSNSFLSGGAFLMVLGSLGMWLKWLPTELWQRFSSLFWMEVEIQDNDRAFWWLLIWFSKHNYCETRARSLTAVTKKVDEDGEYTSKRNVVFAPAPGWHWLFYRGRLTFVQRCREQAEKKAMGRDTPREWFNVFMLTRNRNLIKELIQEAQELVDPDTNKVGIYGVSYESWTEKAEVKKRAAKSVIWKAGQMEAVLGDMTTFLARADWYAERGIPYRRGYLLYGPPGNGKSSAALALASELNYNLAVLSLASSSMNDDLLRNLLSECPRNSIVLLEDVDAAFRARKKEDSSASLTFSGLLNAIDGVAAGEGRILIMTTNHREQLDPALIRQGRADVHVEISHADADQARRMFLKFFPEEAELATQFAHRIESGTLSMAALQGHFLRYADPIVAANTEIDKEGQYEPTQADNDEDGDEGEVGLQAQEVGGSDGEPEGVY